MNLTNNLTKNIKSVKDKAETIQLILKAMDQSELSVKKNTELTNGLLEDMNMIEEDAENTIERLSEKEETKEVFLKRNIEYLMNRITRYENEVYELLNKPGSPLEHKFGCMTLMEYLKNYLRLVEGHEVNDISVILYIEKLIADDLNKQIKELLDG